MRVMMLALITALLIPTSASAQRLDIPDVGQGRLKAERVRYDAKAKVFLAEGDVRLTIGDMEIRSPRLRVDQARQMVFATGGVVVRQPDTVLRARDLTYEIRSRLARASGSVVLEQDKTTVSAGEMMFDLTAQIARARGGVRLQREGSTLTGSEMIAQVKTRLAEVTGEARLVRAPAPPSQTEEKVAQALAGRQTIIEADRMRFRWDANEADAEGSVKVTQPDKSARAKKIAYSESAGVLELVGSVVVEQSNADWLVKGGVVAPSGDPDEAKALAAPAVLSAARLVVRLDTRDMLAEGEVSVEQEGRFATGDRAVYTHRTRTIVVTGNVHMREADGSWLRANRVVISIADETFEAMGNVETEFPMKRGK